MPPQPSFLRKICIVSVASVLVAGFLATLALAVDLVLLLFLAVLFGVFLTQTGVLLGKWLPVAYGFNIAIVNVVLIVTLGSSFFIFGLNIDHQLDRASDQLDESMLKVETWINDHPAMLGSAKKLPFVKDVFSLAPGAETGSKRSAKATNASQTGIRNGSPTDANRKQAGRNRLLEAETISSQMAGRVAGHVLEAFKRTVATTFGLLANLGVIYFAGLFLAINPSAYRDGLASLFPVDQREKVSDVMNQMGESMFDWLNGRFLAMLITGTGTAVALTILGVPMPLTIGAITGLLTFIPNLGAVISLALAVLMALSQGPITVIWVVAVYAFLQLIESNVVTPLIQQRKTSIPPALLLGAQLIMAALTGFLGVMVATPMLAATLTLVREVWIKRLEIDETAHE